MNKHKKIIGLALMCLLFISCASAQNLSARNWGKIVPDEKVTRSFESGVVSADLNYYISGSYVYPVALLGLNKAYILESTLWKKVDIAEEKLKVFVNDMKLRALRFGQSPVGFAVWDDQGKQIGVWYSIISATTAVQMREDRKVMIYAPEQDAYEKGEGKSPIRVN